MRAVLTAVAMVAVVGVKLHYMVYEAAEARRQLIPALARYPHGVLSPQNSNHTRVLLVKWLQEERDRSGTSPAYSPDLSTSPPAPVAVNVKTSVATVPTVPRWVGQGRLQPEGQAQPPPTGAASPEGDAGSHVSTVMENEPSRAATTVTATLPPPPSQASDHTHSNKSTGYVLALDYWEQQTSASRNLQSLQCWAAQFNLSVVEPVMVGSVLRTPLTDPPAGGRFWFRDVFDLEMWNHLSSKLSHSKLVSWEKFVSHAPRDVIMVSFKHAFPSEIRDRLKRLASQPLTEPQLPPSERLKEGCGSKRPPSTAFMSKYRFRVVREVCFNFAYGDKLTMKEFSRHLYGGLPPSGTTVVYRQWRGTGPPARVLIPDAECGNTGIQEEVGPSPSLLHHAAQYQEKYLNGQPYVAIMARMEKVKGMMMKRKQGRLTLAQCFEKLLATWTRTRERSGLNHTFLAIDIGRYGSNSFHSAGDGTDLSVEFERFFRAVQGQRLSVASWEDSFEDVAHTTDSGYVALLQKVLVVQAKCVVFIGGGSFQKHALRLYRQAHPDHRSQCIRIVSECTLAKNLYL